MRKGNSPRPARFVMIIGGLAMSVAGCSQEAADDRADMPSSGLTGNSAPDSSAAKPVRDSAAAKPVEPQTKKFSVEDALALEFPDVARSDINVLPADLNGDGKPEWLIALSSPTYCGTGGCTLLVFQDGAQDWVQIGRMPAVNAPYGVLPSETDWWNDLFVTFRGGGGPSGPYRIRRIDGQYGPSKLPPYAEPIDNPGEVYPVKPGN